MVETLQAAGEFERKPNREIEKKYIPLFPQQLDKFRIQAVPIEQLYLSHPDEPFSLRLRETVRDNKAVYTATLKDRGQLTTEGIDRMEIETEISHETYLHYHALGYPVLRKLRAEPYKNIVVDWFRDGHVQIEAENPISMTGFLEQHKLRVHHFVDHTGDRFVDNEWRAHLEFRRDNDGREPFTPPPELDTEHIARQIWKQIRKGDCVVTIAGRSGSGKTTAIGEIQELLKHNDVESVVLSTDDYHRGKTWLEEHSGEPWSDWDARIVYDIEGLQTDIRDLQMGTAVLHRRYNFVTGEPIVDGEIRPTPVILVEGIYAGDSSFGHLAHLRYEVPTALATCVGRRLLRDIQERPGFGDPASNLRYMLEKAEPSYQQRANEK